MSHSFLLHIEISIGSFNSLLDEQTGVLHFCIRIKLQNIFMKIHNIFHIFLNLFHLNQDISCIN